MELILLLWDGVRIWINCTSRSTFHRDEQETSLPRYQPQTRQWSNLDLDLLLLDSYHLPYYYTLTTPLRPSSVMVWRSGKGGINYYIMMLDATLRPSLPLRITHFLYSAFAIHLISLLMALVIWVGLPSLSCSYCGKEVLVLLSFYWA